MSERDSTRVNVMHFAHDGPVTQRPNAWDDWLRPSPEAQEAIRQLKIHGHPRLGFCVESIPRPLGLPRPEVVPDVIAEQAERQRRRGRA